ncbi:MAG: thiamine pyrophosphate-binding protein [Armatimonadota bacterium]|nr:thiamine pyrophosphate-binding protein [Armatimonadota bacterium]MDR7534329.1 thiamine pyrophosphate-binding protein [Armatimonadota bacterium]MDR7537499.1 thiamine pyrophosphate-binding protein [Armatimonadota bacterium]
MTSDRAADPAVATRMTGGRALVEMLRRHGVTELFAIPGVQNDALFNALYDAAGAIRVVHTRHEQGAAYMALGYARATGRPGVFAVVPGPGVLNATAALATAYAAHARVLCIAGQIPSAQIGRGLGVLHELPDQLAILRGLTKWAARVEHPALLPDLVAEAFQQLCAGRPRPVALEIPTDVLADQAPVTLRDPAAAPAAPAPDPEAVARAAALLARAERPLIMVGSGVDDAGDALLAVAEALQAPVVAGMHGRGAVSDRHYLALTGPAGWRLWADADVVLAVGTRLLRPLTQWGVDDGLTLIRIDIDPLEISRIHPPAVGIVADARQALAALSQALAAHSPVRASREAALRALKADVEQAMSQVQPQYGFLQAMRAALPDDGVFVDEMTQVGYMARYAFPVYRPRTYITPGYQGTLGYGFATALGAKVALPDRAVLSISGDGGFLFTAAELATAVQHRIGVVAVVFNDGAYGNVLRMQQELYGGRVIATRLHNPDFVRLAETFGARGQRATSPAALTAILRAAFERDEPTVVEVPVGEMPEPHAFVRLPRVRPRGGDR